MGEPQAKVKLAHFVIFLIKLGPKDFMFFMFPTCVAWMPIAFPALSWALGKPDD